MLKLNIGKGFTDNRTIFEVEQSSVGVGGDVEVHFEKVAADILGLLIISRQYLRENLKVHFLLLFTAIAICMVDLSCGKPRSSSRGNLFGSELLTICT